MLAAGFGNRFQFLVRSQNGKRASDFFDFWLRGKMAQLLGAATSHGLGKIIRLCPPLDAEALWHFHRHYYFVYFFVQVRYGVVFLRQLCCEIFLKFTVGLFAFINHRIDLRQIIGCTTVGPVISTTMHHHIFLSSL